MNIPDKRIISDEEAKAISEYNKTQEPILSFGTKVLRVAIGAALFFSLKYGYNYLNKSETKQYQDFSKNSIDALIKSDEFKSQFEKDFESQYGKKIDIAELQQSGIIKQIIDETTPEMYEFMVNIKNMKNEKVMEMIEKGIITKLDIKNYGNAPVLATIVTQNQPLLEYFINTVGTDPNDENDVGETLLSYALSFRNGKALDFLLTLQNLDIQKQYSSNKSSVGFYLVSGEGKSSDFDVKAMKKLISKGLDVNYQNADGETVLICAVYFEKGKEMIREIINNGGNLFLQTNGGRSIFDYIMVNDDLDLLKYVFDISLFKDEKFIQNNLHDIYFLYANLLINYKTEMLDVLVSKGFDYSQLSNHESIREYDYMQQAIQMIKNDQTLTMEVKDNLLNKYCKN